MCKRSNLTREPTDWKAGCPKRACPVWREGRGSNPRPYPYPSITDALRRVAAAEINEVGRASGQRRLGGVQLQFPQRGFDVAPDGRRIFVGVHLEVAEVTALAA